MSSLDAFFEIFVVDPGYHLVGSVSLDILLRSKRPVRISDLMKDDRQRIQVDDKREDVARLFQRYNLVSAAVVDGGVAQFATQSKHEKVELTPLLLSSLSEISIPSRDPALDQQTLQRYTSKYIP